MHYKKQPQCLEWACWLVSYREGQQYPEKIKLHNPIPCAGSFADSEKTVLRLAVTEAPCAPSVQELCSFCWSVVTARQLGAEEASTRLRFA